MGVKHKTKRDLAAMERRRWESLRLLGRKVAQADVARRLGVSLAAVRKWDARRKARPGSASQRRAQGKPPKLTPRHKEQLCRALKKGAHAHGFLNESWTLPRPASSHPRPRLLAPGSNFLVTRL